MKEQTTIGTTSEFLKLRSEKEPKVGEWNINYNAALAKAKKEGKFIVTAWSNGDACGFCVNAEKCMLTSVFKDWMKKQDVYFVFQYGGDKDKGKTLHDWIYCKGTKLKYYPGFRITFYDANGSIAYDESYEGNKLRNNKSKENGAKAMVTNLEAVFAKKPAVEPIPESDDKPVAQDYKVRLNEKLTVKKVNAILDAIDKNDGYCPCQPRGEGTKCHCEDFIKEKKIGEPCICKIYVKQKK